MPTYDQLTPLFSASLVELQQIARYSTEREELNPRTVLIGGWAVHSYNPWYGSIHIDLITNSRMRGSINQFLREERGFVPVRGLDDSKRVIKIVPPYGDVKIDYTNREVLDYFEGTEASLSYDLVDGRVRRRIIGGVASMLVPERSILLVFKLKAAWDREYRVAHGTSPDRDWEMSKALKDRADVLSLLDPKYGGDEVDPNLLGEIIQGYPFLIDLLDRIASDKNAVLFYGRMDSPESKKRIRRLIALI